MNTALENELYVVAKSHDCLGLVRLNSLGLLIMGLLKYVPPLPSRNEELQIRIKQDIQQ